MVWWWLRRGFPLTLRSNPHPTRQSKPPKGLSRPLVVWIYALVVAKEGFPANQSLYKSQGPLQIQIQTIIIAYSRPPQGSQCQSPAFLCSECQTSCPSLGRFCVPSTQLLIETFSSGVVPFSSPQKSTTRPSCFFRFFFQGKSGRGGCPGFPSRNRKTAKALGRSFGTQTLKGWGPPSRELVSPLGGAKKLGFRQTHTFGYGTFENPSKMHDPNHKPPFNPLPPQKKKTKHPLCNSPPPKRKKRKAKKAPSPSPPAPKRSLKKRKEKETKKRRRAAPRSQVSRPPSAWLRMKSSSSALAARRYAASTAEAKSPRRRL